MEGLIIGFIVMAIAAIFNRKNTDEETAKPKNTAPANRQRTVKRAEDYAKEIYGELQTQVKERPERTRQIAKKAEETVASSRTRNPESKREVPVRAATGRLTADQTRPSLGADTRSRTAADNVFPLEKEDLKKSIILSEILMPPKSKRR
ncbi:hypothetical protein [Planomicrobium sp. CPCC 101079]|uniref:hypothetical protein n=1 Tax=Planomicrobium sp. CPCC 101079 TaxID=2599618 RepID=UPI0011B73861|nr:hypothetical protein [Planomicrobium sp. CPCC 101079]TWT09093.1 hypothetical protein FQV28_05520 [Planomicrobium sp. CPCC 101079]